MQVQVVDRTTLPPLQNSFVGTGIHNDNGEERTGQKGTAMKGRKQKLSHKKAKQKEPEAGKEATAGQPAGAENTHS